MTKGIRLCSLAFHGPSREPAVLMLGEGLNVIYGASDTGKSFIVDSIDFMLGGKGPLRDIPERVGYDRVLLALETIDKQKFTVQRSTEGGAFRLFEGLFSDTLPSGDGKILADQHSDRSEDNLSAFLLSKVDLSHRRLRRNKRGDTQSLSFRNLARLLVINEEEIIQQRSPLSDGNYTADTANTAAFKLLLTGVDDSSLVSSQPKSPEEQSRGAQLDLLDQLIQDYRKQVRDLAGPRDELEDQLDRLDATMEAQSEQLSIEESTFRQYAVDRRDVARRVEDARNRLAEATSLVDRFTLLSSHYTSDIARLKAIEEAGSLFRALSHTDCPLCGSPPAHHKFDSDCDGNVDKVVTGARAEIVKIELRQSELVLTIETLRKDAVSLEKRLPGLEVRLSNISREIERVVSPNLQQLRTSYKKLADKGGEVREALAIHRGLVDLEDRKSALEKEDDTIGPGANVSDTELSSVIVDKFAALVQEILTAWHFPNPERVHFDLKARDLVINGKNRVSYGKGLRAITQASFTIGLLEYCRRYDTPHPGFTILDSPLLSYKAPDGNEDDLSGTDLKDSFYDYLLKTNGSRQVIIVENTDPPQRVEAHHQAIKFTGMPGVGRSGLFPTIPPLVAGDIPSEEG